KHWVLQQYLNTIYFGRGAWGIQAAAQAYFGKDISEIDISQGAYLAAVIQQPSRFADPNGSDLAAAKARWQAVIGATAETGALAPVIQQPYRIADPKGSDTAAAKAPGQAVLDAKVETGALAPEEAAGQRFCKLAKATTTPARKGQVNYMLDQVREELHRMGYTD